MSAIELAERLLNPELAPLLTNIEQRESWQTASDTLHSFGCEVAHAWIMMEHTHRQVSQVLATLQGVAD